MVRRAAAVLILAGAWCAWTVLAARLDRPSSTNAMLAAVALIALPLATGIVAALAVGFHGRRRELVVAVAIGWALALVGTLTDYPTVAGLGKILLAGGIGLLFVEVLVEAWHVAAVAVLVIGVDTYSVFAGPTKRLLESGGTAVSVFTVPITGPGLYAAAGLGVIDFLFLGLFCGAALNWRLRPRLTIPLCMLSFSASVVIAVHEHRSIPALPLLSLAFLVPNVRRFLPGAPDRPWEARTRPATTANARRNATAQGERRALWLGAQASCWNLLDPLIQPGAVVGIVGAGNCDDIPLAQIAERALRVDLLDLDPAACRAAIGAAPRGLRPRLVAIDADASGGHADRISAAVVAGRVTQVPGPDWSPFGEGPYDVLIGDLFYSQLLYPGLRDAGVSDDRIKVALSTYGPALTGLVVSRMHASAADGIVVHIHDPVGWWRGHEQPFTLDHILAIARHSAEDALVLLQSGSGPEGTNPRTAVSALGIPVLRTAFWRWPFSPGKDFLVCGTVASLPANLRPRS
jgi:hypothetical protein